MRWISYLFVLLNYICYSYAGLNTSTFHFHFATKDTRFYEITDTSVPTGLFTENSEIIVIVPGWTENSYLQWVHRITKAYLARTDRLYHVIAAEWGYEANGWYYNVANIVEMVGQYIGEWMIRRAERDGFEMDRYHVLSNSIGCQVAGFIGKYVIEELGRPLSRITALDAAGPGFYFKGPEERLYKGDAKILVALHTDNGWKGITEPYADVDFYPNGGIHPQPGCHKTVFDYFLEPCSHRRAHKLWEEGLLTYAFYGTKCDSWDNYKEGLCDHNKRLNFAGNMTSIQKRHSGLYYTKTNSESPLIIN